MSSMLPSPSRSVCSLCSPCSALVARETMFDFDQRSTLVNGTPAVLTRDCWGNQDASDEQSRPQSESDPVYSWRVHLSRACPPSHSSSHTLTKPLAFTRALAPSSVRPPAIASSYSRGLDHSPTALPPRLRPHAYHHYFTGCPRSFATHKARTPQHIHRAPFVRRLGGQKGCNTQSLWHICAGNIRGQMRREQDAETAVSRSSGRHQERGGQRNVAPRTAKSASLFPARTAAFS